MPKLALKINVATLRGTQQGVPRLVKLLQKHDANATFLFSLGPDRTGRAISRMLRPGFLKTLAPTSVLERYGVKTLFYGTLLPARISDDLARRCYARCARRGSKSAFTRSTA